MAQVVELNQIEQLARIRQEWGEMLAQTPGASFFQSLEWLEIYWRHFGAEQKLRVLVALEDDRPTGILPLVVRNESTRVGQLRVLTFPLHGWGSFYGPIGPDAHSTLVAGLEHIRHTHREWDILELRWQGAIGTDPMQTERAMLAAGYPTHPTVWDHTSVVDLEGSWESYWASRKGAWLRRFRHAEQKLAEQGEISYTHYRPLGRAHDDGSPRWDLYDACETIARRSWQGAATNGTTLSHETVRTFLRETHEAASAAGATDLHLMLVNGEPTAFVYGYHYRGYAYGLRRGFDAQRSREGAGNLLMAQSLHDCFARGDRVYDMGVGSLETKRHFQTRLLPIMRFTHFPPSAIRTQLLRLGRWWRARRLPASIKVGHVQDSTADAR